MLDVGRRDFIGLLGGAAVGWPLAARGESSPKLRIIGVLAGASGESARPQSDSFRQGLRDLGYVEGIDFELVYRSAGGQMQRLPSLAKDLVGLRPDAILAVPTPATVAARAASQTIPIISFMLSDEFASGWWRTLPDPAVTSPDWQCAWTGWPVSFLS